MQVCRASTTKLHRARCAQQVRGALASAKLSARLTCEKSPFSADCTVAWDIFDELLATTARLAEDVRDDTDPLEQWCLSHPSDLECRVYDV